MVKDSTIEFTYVIGGALRIAGDDNTKAGQLVVLQSPMPTQWCSPPYQKPRRW